MHKKYNWTDGQDHLKQSKKHAHFQIAWVIATIEINHWNKKLTS